MARILVVEDEKLLRQAIVKKLELAGFETIAVTSGKEALDTMRGAEILPDAVWLDYYLPDVNGIEFMSQVKSDAKLAGVPVVVVSNSASANVVDKMLSLGVKEYILKVDQSLEDIVKTVGKYTQK